MNKFTDGNKNEWTINLTLGDIKRVRNETEIDLNKLLRNATDFGELLFDPERIGALLWVLCERQAIAKNITPEMFYDSFDGDNLRQAYHALVCAVADFCQTPKIASEMKANLSKMIETGDKKGASELLKRLGTVLAEVSE